MRRTAIAALLVGGLLVTACGDDDAETADTPADDRSRRHRTAGTAPAGTAEAAAATAPPASRSPTGR